MGRKNKKRTKPQNSKRIRELEKELNRLQHIVESFSRRSREYLIGESKYDTIRIAVIGDTHIGSLYERIDALNEFYKLLKSEKIDTVFHCGDLLDGHKIYKGQEYDQYALGFSKQLESLIERYPKIKGIETFFILGNHDASFKRQSGIITGKIIEQVRPDLHYLDQDVATVKLKTKSGKTAKYQLIHPSGGTTYAVCFDDKTEILTENGWKLFKDLEFHEKVATLNPKTLELEFQLPEQWIDEPYDEVMLHFNNRNIDCMVTPNHRMFVRKVWGFKWKLVQAKDIKPRKYKFLRTIPNWKGKKAKYIELPFPKVKKRGKLQNFVRIIKIEDFVQFLGWFISEGNVGHKNKCVEINQSKEKNKEKYREICNLIKRMGFTYYETQNKIKITSLQLYEIFKDFGKCNKKRIPKQIKEFDKNLLLLLLNALFKGDGTFRKGKIQNYSTASKQLADDIQEIAMKCGLSCVIKKYDNKKSNFKHNFPIYQLSIGHKIVEPEFGIKPKKVKYKGRIYCVKVPNEIILVRRNGKPIFTGNSYKSQKIIESYSGGKKPDAVFIGHYHKADHMPCFRNVQAIQVGCFISQTPYMLRKPTSAHIGGWIIEHTIGKLTNRFKTEFIAFYEK